MFKETPYDASLFEDVLKTNEVNERENKIINSDEPMIFPKAYSWVPDDYDFTRRKAMKLLVIDPPRGCFECCFVTVRTFPDPDVECMLTKQVVRDYIFKGKNNELKPLVCPLLDYKKEVENER